MPPSKARWPLAEISGNTPAQVVQHIMAIAPSEAIQNSIVPPLANTQLLSAISELNCPSVLRRPIQLPCERLVCARCLTEWIHLRGSLCPCCYDTSPLECTQLKPASRMVQLLLNDVMVSCKRNVRAADYDTHTCTDEVNKEEMQLVHTVVHRMLDASKENCIHIPTGGTPLTLARVTVPKAPITQLSKRTLRALSANQRQQLLHSAGIKLNIEPTQGLAIKSMIGLPWYRLRTLSRWLKHSGISIGSERKHRALCRELIGDNLEVELAPFSFKLADGGEEIRGAAHAYTPSLTAKITQLLEQNEMRQLASLSSKNCRAVLTDLACECGQSKSNVAKDYGEGYVCKKCFNAIAKYSALQEEVQNRKRELLSKLSRHVGSSATHETQGTKRSADTVPHAAHAVKVVVTYQDYEKKYNLSPTREQIGKCLGRNAKRAFAKHSLESPALLEHFLLRINKIIRKEMTNRAEDPHLTPASVKVIGLSGEVTVRSKAAGLPRCYQKTHFGGPRYRVGKTRFGIRG
eukprot:Em0001g2438a